MFDIIIVSVYICSNIDYFVLDNKNTATYRNLLKREKIDIDSFLMVGNSPKSDILVSGEYAAGDFCILPEYVYV